MNADQIETTPGTPLDRIVNTPRNEEETPLLSLFNSSI